MAVVLGLYQQDDKLENLVPAKVLQYPKTVIENGKRYNTQFRTHQEKAEIHSADPIREENDIDQVVLYFLENQKWRDAMLFVLGCNTAFRISDLLCYRVSDVIDLNGQGRLSFMPEEQKTGNFRKVYYNKAIQSMIALYLEMDKTLQPKSFLFYNQSNNARLCRMDDGSEVVEAMTRQAADKLMKTVTAKLGITGHYSTHSWRQTFTYHFQKMMFGDREKIGIPMTIQALQMMLGHSKISSTMHYSTYIEEEISNLYGEMNLGLDAIEHFNRVHI